MRIATFSKSSDDAHLLLGRAVGQIFRRSDRTESYVCIPPALIITDSDGGTWTLGTEYNTHFEWNVLRNDRNVGEFASRIDYHRDNTGGVLRIYGREYGSKTLSRNKRTFI